MTSIGAAGALFQPPVMQSSLSGLGGSDPIGNLLQALNGPPDSAPAPTAPASPAAPPPGASGPFDPSTFTALLSAQEQAAPASSSGGSGDATGIDPSSTSSATDGSGADSSGGTTTETVTNPDGSVTTITTYGDGTVSESTAAPAQGANMTATMGDDGDDLANSLQQLTALVQPFASIAAAALL